MGRVLERENMTKIYFKQFIIQRKKEISKRVTQRHKGILSVYLFREKKIQSEFTTARYSLMGKIMQQTKRSVVFGGDGEVGQV